MNINLQIEASEIEKKLNAEINYYTEFLDINPTKYGNRVSGLSNVSNKLKDVLLNPLDEETFQKAIKEAHQILEKKVEHTSEEYKQETRKIIRALEKRKEYLESIEFEGPEPEHHREKIFEIDKHISLLKHPKEYEKIRNTAENLKIYFESLGINKFKLDYESLTRDVIDQKIKDLIEPNLKKIKISSLENLALSPIFNEFIKNKQNQRQNQNSFAKKIDEVLRKGYKLSKSF